MIESLPHAYSEGILCCRLINCLFSKEIIGCCCCFFTLTFNSSLELVSCIISYHHTNSCQCRENMSATSFASVRSLIVHIQCTRSQLSRWSMIWGAWPHSHSAAPSIYPQFNMLVCIFPRLPKPIQATQSHQGLVESCWQFLWWHHRHTLLACPKAQSKDAVGVLRPLFVSVVPSGYQQSSLFQGVRCQRSDICYQSSFVSYIMWYNGSLCSSLHVLSFPTSVQAYSAT